MNARSIKHYRLVLASLMAVATLATVAAPRVLAEDGEYNRFSLGPRAAYFDPKDSDDATWMGGAQLRVPFTPALALEGSIDYRKDEYANGAVTVHTYPVQASLLFYLNPNKPVSPYLLGGAGWYFTKVEVDAINMEESDNRFGLHAGGGLQFWLSPSVSMDGSYRYIWLDNLKTQDSSLQNKEFNDSGHMVTIGLNFHI